jgi:DNA-binding CsgD family transcriptional regulator
MVTDDCPLSPREHQVILHAMAGRDHKQTAQRLGVSPSTVRTYRHKAIRKLGVDSVGKAIVIMLREGWAPHHVLIPDWPGGAYSPHPTRPWVPSPAQRLYLDAFDRMLSLRTERAVADVEFCFGVLVHESGAPGSRRGRPDLDAMLLGMARACLAPTR